MLLPSGRCYNHCRVVVWWQMLLPVADGKATRSITSILVLRCLNRTSSQTCGRWYLPTFLLRDGSLTLMYRASFIVLIWFKFSLPTILKLLMVTLWPLMLLWSYMGEGDFRCSLNLFPKILEVSPIYSSSHPPYHIDICRWLHFASGLDLCLWEPSGGSWWWCLLCNTPVPQTFCQCS